MRPTPFCQRSWFRDVTVASPSHQMVQNSSVELHPQCTWGLLSQNWKNTNAQCHQFCKKLILFWPFRRWLVPYLEATPHNISQTMTDPWPIFFFLWILLACLNFNLQWKQKSRHFATQFFIHDILFFMVTLCFLGKLNASYHTPLKLKMSMFSNSQGSFPIKKGHASYTTK